MRVFIIGLAVLTVSVSSVTAQPKIGRAVPEDIEPIPLLPSVVEELKIDRAKCVDDAQKVTASAPTYLDLHIIGIHENLGRGNVEGMMRQIFEGLTARAKLQPELAKPANRTQFQFAYRACMRQKGYAQPKD